MTERTSIIHLTDLTGLNCTPDMPLRDTLVRMNATPDVFQLVVDQTGKLLGTLTDGDVRRALLAGAAIGDSITNFMNPKPITELAHDLLSAQRRLIEMSGHARFLPLLDSAGCVRSVLVQRLTKPVFPTVLIMAGGRGSRLGNATDRTPKPLVSVRGQPMLEHVLQLVERAGVRDVYVSAHYLAEQIDDFCKARKGETRLTVLKESTPCGTAGAISLIPESVEGTVLVINGDVVTNIDLKAMYELHDRQDWDATIAVARHELEIPFGVVKIDDKAGFLGIQEKPRIQNFVSAGIYFINEMVRRLVPKGQRIDMPQLFELGREAGLKIGVFPLHENWRDVGRPADLEAVNIDAAGRS